MITELRQSAIKAWFRCKAQFYVEYILGDKAQFDPDLALGSLYHSEIESYHNGQSYDQKLLQHYTQAVGRTEGELSEHRFIFTPKHPIHGELLGMPITGTIDRIVPGLGMYDVKTSKGSWSQKKADEPLGNFNNKWPELSGIQPTAYLYYWWQEHGELLPFTFIVIRKDWVEGKRFSPVQTVTTERAVADFAAFWDLSNQLIKDIQAERLWPCTCGQHAWLREVIT